MYKPLSLLVVILLGLATALAVDAFNPPPASPPTGGGAIGVEQNTPANSFYIKSNGNIGIGTTGPVTKLHIEGSGPDASGLSLKNTAAGGRHWYIEGGDNGFGGTAGNLLFRDITAGGGPIRMVIDSSGNVGIATTTPGYKLTVQGDIYATGNIAGGGQMTGNVSAGQVSAGIFGSVAGKGNYTFQAAANTNPVLFVDATNERVGIGTTGPGAKLDVIAPGVTAVTDNGIRVNRPDSQGQYAFMGYGNLSSDAYFGSVYTGSVGVYGSIHLRQYTQAGVFRDALNIDSGGNVGIGTAVPSVLLELKPTSGDAFIKLTRPTTAEQSTLGFSTGATNDWLIRTLTNSDLNIYSYGTASNVLTILKASGNVGIGVTNPAVKLEVAANTAIKVGNAYLSSGGDYTHLANNEWYNGTSWTTNGSAGVLYQQTGQVNTWYTHDTLGNHTQRMSLDSSGNLVVSGNISAGGTMTGNVSAAQVSSGVFGSVAGKGYYEFQHYNSTADVMYIDATNDRVGIGTTGPGYKLDVSGETRISGNLNFGNIGLGPVGVYDPTKTQAVWAMGPAYVLPAGGGTTSYGTLYGLAWSYNPDYGGVGNNPQSKAGLNHQLLVMNNAVTQTAIGTGIWTLGNLTAPIMYDYNNPSYYVDPASNSVMNIINGGTPITSSNIGSQSVSYAASAGSVPWSGVTGFTGDTTPDTIADDGIISTGETNFTNQNLGTSASPTFAALTVSGDVALGDNVGTDLTVGGGSGKINAGTVDPIYTIGGTKYATYLPGMTGVKEETTGVLQLQSNEQGVITNEIDFGKVEKGSDLWLLYQTTDFGENWENLVALLTPSFDGKTWYEKKPNEKKLVIYGEPTSTSNNKYLEVSYRFTAPRFDFKKWGNVSSDISAGFVIEEK